MNRRKRATLLPCLAVLLAANLCGREAGALYEKGGAQGIDARAMGMAGAFSAVAGDETAIWWNPAGLAALPNPRISTVFGSLYDGRQQQAGLCAGYPLPTGAAAGLSWVHLTYPQASLVSSDSLGAAGSLPLTTDRRLVAGAGLKILFGSLGARDSGFQGVGLDVGAQYKMPLRSETETLTAGLRVLDVDTRLQWADGRQEAVPQSLAAGLAYRPDAVTVAALDVEWIRTAEDSGTGTRLLRLGVERWLEDTVGVRAGYLLDNRRLSTFGLGAGVKILGWELEYGLLGEVANLGLSHRLSLSYGLPQFLRPQPLTGPGILKPLPTPAAAAPEAELKLLADPAVFSPGYYGTASAVTFKTEWIRGDNTLVAAWRLSIENREGAIARYLDGVGYPENIVWDGRDQQDQVCPEGVYLARLLLADAREKRLGHAETTVEIKTQLQEIRLQIDPAELLLIGSLPASSLRFDFQGQGLAGPGGELIIRNPDGKIIRTFRGLQTLPQSLVWEPSRGGKKLAPGTYSAQISFSDQAGNRLSDLQTFRVVQITPFVSLQVSPRVFLPGDLGAETVTFRLQAGPPERITAWALEIRDTESGQVVNRLTGLGAPPATLNWGGRDQRGQWIKNGRYFECRLLATYATQQVIASPACGLATDIQTQDAGQALSLHLTALTFAQGSSTIAPYDFKNLQQAADTIKKYAKHYRVLVMGYTDKEEAQGQDLELSRARARQVAEYLRASAGIPEERIETVGYGAAGRGGPGDARNRRVEVVLVIQK